MKSVRYEQVKEINYLYTPNPQFGVPSLIRLAKKHPIR